MVTPTILRYSKIWRYMLIQFTLTLILIGILEVLSIVRLTILFIHGYRCKTLHLTFSGILVGPGIPSFGVAPGRPVQYPPSYIA